MSQGRQSALQAQAAHQVHLSRYQLGDCLGKGAFGSVFRGLNWTTGETVAVKQIKLGNIPKSELSEIMSEIDLLKNLKHPNIVKYLGSEKTNDFLFIILEYCENGSLQHFCKRFGVFPEGLVGVYIAQVLEGLIYLHDQGVIHRDIKGANILTTKDGSVKLADFGVATRTGAMSDYAVVGSPYWMAPEVIDQSGATTASDIWSVGCVVIELLEGKPPYHFLPPMSALFRMVQDDCPPLPERASPIVKDFLFHCFQKDQNLRVSARKLMRHPWMLNAKRQLDQLREGSSIGSRRTVHDEAVKSVQKWNLALKEPPKPANTSTVGSTSVGDVSVSITALPIGKAAPAPSLVAQRQKLVNLQQPEEQKDSWDDDFEDDITTTKIAALEKGAPAAGQTSIEKPASPEATRRPLIPQFDPQSAGRPAPLVLQARPIVDNVLALFDGDDDARTIRPTRSPRLNGFAQLPSISSPSFGSSMNDTQSNQKTVQPLPNKMSRPRIPVGLASPPPPTPAKQVEDYSDLVSEGEEVHLSRQIKQYQRQNSVGKLFHPNDLKALTSSGSVTLKPSSSSTSAPATVTNLSAAAAAGSSSPSTRSSSGLPQRPHPTPTGTMASAKTDPTGQSSSDWKKRDARRALGRYSEVDDDDYSDLAASTSGSNGALQLVTSQQHTEGSSPTDDFDEFDDPFAEIDESLNEEADPEANIARDKHARMCAHVSQLVESLVPDAGEEELVASCEELSTLLGEYPDMKAQVFSSHGALAIVQMLEVIKGKHVAGRLLSILNLIIEDDPGAQETFCLIGAIPVVMMFTSKRFSHELRLQAAKFLFTMCSTSSLTLQFVLSCRGLKTLVDLIDEDYNEQRDLVWLGVGCVNSVLELQSPASRNDFCRMLVKEGLLDPLTTSLLSVLADDSEERAMTAKEHILQTFVICSQSDSWLKKQLAVRAVLRRVLKACSHLKPGDLVIMLKVIKNLSMSPAVLDDLQQCNTIDFLTTILAKHYDGEHGTEVANQVLNAMYNLCRLNKSRQEEAAQSGIIPLFLRVARTGSPLKQFALPILCDFAHAGKATRKTFWQHNGLGFYLELLSDPYWQVSALESINVWMQDETARVEDVLLRPNSIECLLQAFNTSKANSFENLVEPFLKIMRLSPGVTLAMGKSPSFFQRLIDQLGHITTVVRVNLLRIAKLVCDVHPDRDRQGVIERYGLFQVIDELSRKDASVLVRQLAVEILDQRYMQHSRDTVQAPAKVVRRTASETNVAAGLNSAAAGGASGGGAGGSAGAASGLHHAVGANGSGLGLPVGAGANGTTLRGSPIPIRSQGSHGRAAGITTASSKSSFITHSTRS
ncbi:Protein kinase of the Mitotic Exit Network [Tilletia horrida]|uniref:non-specific serine/threonine protein kinase n=1 Tax=Tilletia horrida TaxID=155126 RepID=A0AAN6JP79_9BASI|nr:Protein kinase of the Mitotic Exit Network [Tilletia horrida]KAK0561128.1 Protein kinase of the Mitotic Exit Network [Tilletia horrida]